MDILGKILPAVIIGIVILVVLGSCVKIVPQSRAYVITRLGVFHSVWNEGLKFKLPFVDRIVKNISLKEQVVDFAPQPVITKDNVTMQIDSVVYFQITDPKLYTYGIENPMSAIENLTATTLRNLIGDLDLEQTLTSRDHINTKMRALLDEATDPWGIKVNRVELKNIMPPRDIQEAMEKQMRAERERRESVLQAQGKKESQILVAEGEQQAAILRANASKEAAILQAEGAKQASILQAEGAKQAKILDAEAEALAILKVQQATADAIRLINESSPGQGVLTIKALEAFQAAANGKATKIIIPSELQGLAGLAASAKTVFDTEDPKATITKTVPKQ
ncbi:MAG: SPFH/Band 7/PHB domain protein [Lawsonibacter sp.]|nr:SPFH/Band 7/PHB domain protein [Lawsonibacter sp.]